MAVHSHCVESVWDLLQRYVGEGLVTIDNEKNTNFPAHPVCVDFEIILYEEKSNPYYNLQFIS